MEDYRVTQTGDEIQEIFNQSPVDTSDISELKEATTSLDGRLESVEGKIPSGASSENPLTDKQYVDSSIASASATFRGTYNEVTDIELTTEATHAEIGEALASVIDTADSNDYCFVQIPTADATPTEIGSVERYKFVTGTGWEYEYTLNNSGFTADQWTAINSGITSGLVAKLTDLPTNAELNTLLNGKANAADVYTKSETYTKTEIDTQLGAKANSADVYPKTDTYTKQEVDALITTPEVQYVTVTATSGTTSVTEVLPATGDANTIYRVGSWDGTQYATGVYSEYAWNGTTYILLDVKNYGLATGSDFDNPTTAQRELVTTVGSVLDGISEGVFDLTAKTGDSYATLADALTAANTAIPPNKKKGGMSIKFVQSSDNKYVCYFLNSQTWTVDVTKWEKINLEKEVNQRVKISPGINLFNKSTAKLGYLIDASGNEQEYVSYNASDYISVEAETTYYKSAETGSNVFRFVNFYNSNKSHIGTRVSDVASFTTPENCAFVRVTFYTGNSYAYAQVSKQNTKYYPYTPISGYPADTLQDDVVSTVKVQAKAITVPKLGDDVPALMDSKIAQTASGFVAKSVGKNLFDPTTAELNSILDSGGQIESNQDSYNTSDFISVESGETYSQSVEMGNTHFRFICFYDSTKTNLIGSRLGDQSSFTVPSGASFARITFYKGSSYNYAQVTKGSTQEHYTLYTPIGGYVAEKLIDDVVSTSNVQNKAVTLPKLGNDVNTRFSNIESKLLDNIEDYNGTNLVNPSGIVDGFWNGGAVPSSDYKYAQIDISSLTAGSTLSFLWSNGDVAEGRFVQFYKGTTQKTAYNAQKVSSVTIPEDADSVYISFSSWRITHDYEFGVFNSSSPTWESYIQATKAKWTKQSQNKQVLARLADLEGLIPNDVLKGKKWCPLGDSFTAGSESDTFDDGIYAGQNKVYPYYIGNRTGINVVSTFFGSGRTLAFPATPGDFANSICNPSAACYYQNIPADTDYITIYLGINDSHHAPGSSGGDGEDNTGEIPIGTIEDATTATYYGAWNVVLSWLIENRPFAHIGILISNGCDTADYRTAQIAVARKYGIPFIDLNGDDRTPFMIRSTNSTIPSAIRSIRTQVQAVNYPTNTHPNDTAHEFESYFIENFLKTI